MSDDKQKLAEVPKIHDVTLRDVPGRLRDMADKIERGIYGDIITCAIVLVHEKDDKVHVFGYGERSEHDTIGITLLAGANMVARNI